MAKETYEARGKCTNCDRENYPQWGEYEVGRTINSYPCPKCECMTWVKDDRFEVVNPVKEYLKDTLPTKSETWQDRAKQLVELRKNPASDINSINRLMGTFGGVNLNGLSQEDLELLNSVTRY